MKSLHLLFFFIAFQNAALAAQTMPDPLESFCSQILQAKAQVNSSPLARMALGFRVSLEAASFIGAAPLTPLSPTDLHSPQLSHLRIFTLGRNHTLTEEDGKALAQVRAEQMKQIQVMKQLSSARNAKACVRLAKQLNWSVDQITSLESLENSALEASRHEEAKDSLDAANSTVRGHPDWEIVAVDSWSEILQSLLSQPTSGVVLFAHADPYGRLYDSMRDEFPTGFFKALPTSLKFVGIFSCESDQVVKAYNLNALAKDREFVTVSLGAPFNEVAAAPIQFFEPWMQKIEKRKLLNFDLSKPAGSQEPFCSLKFQNLKLVQGNLTVTLQGMPIGIWTPEEAEASRLFPCSWLSSGTMSLFLQPSAINESLSLETDHLSAIISGPEIDNKVLQSLRTFKTAQGNFRSALLSVGQKRQ